MADVSGKAKGGADAAAVAAVEGEAIGGDHGFDKYLLPGPWTEEDERMFEFMIREFGEGHGGRDSDL